MRPSRGGSASVCRRLLCSSIWRQNLIFLRTFHCEKMMENEMRRPITPEKNRLRQQRCAALSLDVERTEGGGIRPKLHFSEWSPRNATQQRPAQLNSHIFLRQSPKKPP